MKFQTVLERKKINQNLCSVWNSCGFNTYHMNKIHIISIFSLLTFGLVNAQETDSLKYESEHFENLYAISDSVYRSEQPSRKAFKELEEYGFKTVINFRRLWNDNRKARDTDLNLVHLPMRTAKLTEAEVIEALKAVNNAQKPILLHCWHGSDRTGVIVAAYRMVFENWTKEDAISEFRHTDFGYHESWYPHLIEILENLDTEAIRQQLELE